VQESDWNVASAVTPNHKRKPFDDVRVRRALTLAIDRWNGAPALSKIAIVKTIGGIVFPGSPLAATREELEQIAGYWPDIDKSRAEAKRLLKEAGAEGLSFELLNRNVDQPYKYVATWLIDEWSKIGLHVTQRVVPSGPWFEAMRNGDFDVVLEAPGHGLVNPLLDVQKALPASVDAENYGHFEDTTEVDLYQELLHETDPARQRALMRQFEKYVLDDQSHMIWASGSARHTSSTRTWRRSGSINNPRTGGWDGDPIGAIGNEPRCGFLVSPSRCDVRGNTETRRHPDLCDPGRRTAEL